MAELSCEEMWQEEDAASHLDNDFLLAQKLQEIFDEEAAYEFNLKEWVQENNNAATPKQTEKRLKVVDEFWELNDPNPNIHALFVEFNKAYFWGKLDGVEVRWSPKMTLCAGLCCYEGRGGLCSIRLSEPLLKLRPRKDLVETLLHEMIHAYLFVTQNNKDHESHGPEFHKHMYRINSESGAHITVFHNFHEEVDSCRVHWWQCNGPCRKRHPFYGIVKRAMNRAPSRRDPWWDMHQKTCGGTFIKIKEPEPKGLKRKNETGSPGNTKKLHPGCKDIRSFFHDQSSSSSREAIQSAKPSVFPSASKNGHISNLKSSVGNVKVGPKQVQSPTFVPFTGKGNILGRSLNGSIRDAHPPDRMKNVMQSIAKASEEFRTRTLSGNPHNTVSSKVEPMKESQQSSSAGMSRNVQEGMANLIRSISKSAKEFRQRMKTHVPSKEANSSESAYKPKLNFESLLASSSSRNSLPVNTQESESAYKPKFNFENLLASSSSLPVNTKESKPDSALLDAIKADTIASSEEETIPILLDAIKADTIASSEEETIPIVWEISDDSNDGTPEQQILCHKSASVRPTEVSKKTALKQTKLKHRSVCSPIYKFLKIFDGKKDKDDAKKVTGAENDDSKKMAGAASATQMLQCPVCDLCVPEERINGHLDECLS